MKPALATYPLFLTTILFATLLGAITYSHIVYFPVYLSNLPASSVVVNGTYALNEGNFWMLIHPLLVLSFVLTLTVNWKFPARRKPILITFAVYLLVLAISFLYFVPELGAFRNSPQSNIPAAEWLQRGNRWQYLSWARGVTCYCAFVLLLVALTKPAESRG